MDGCAVCGRGPGLRGPTDAAQAEGVQSSGEHPSQDAAARGAAVIWVDDRQPVLRTPLQVEVVIVGVDGATPGDLQGGVGGVGGGLQENSSTNLEDQVDDQVDGPFVWETTVSLTDLQKTDQNQIFFRNKVMCSVHTLLGTL